MVALRDWVQLRIATNKPAAITTEAEKEIIETKRKLVYDVDGNGHYETRKVPTKLKIKQTVYEGGKVIQLIRGRDFYDILGIGLRENSMIELDADQVKLLKGKGITV